LRSRLKPTLTSRLQASRGSVLLAKNGKVILAKGYGVANIELDVPNKPETKFRLGSITKQFTAAAILQLQEKGMLRVEDPISKYIPGTPAAWSGITIHHLLTHTSGIPNYTNDTGYQVHMREPVGTPLGFIKRFRDRPLEFMPGENFHYDNSGYFLLGIIIEQVSGIKYEDYRARISSSRCR
jgi:CubicO group peptidase (beta-lactamase class C family)